MKKLGVLIPALACLVSAEAFAQIPNHYAAPAGATIRAECAFMVDPPAVPAWVKGTPYYAYFGHGKLPPPGPPPAWALQGSTWLAQPISVTSKCNDLWIANNPATTPATVGGALPSTWIPVKVPASKVSNPWERATWPGDAQTQWGASNRGAVRDFIFESAKRGQRAQREGRSRR